MKSFDHHICYPFPNCQLSFVFPKLFQPSPDPWRSSWSSGWCPWPRNRSFKVVISWCPSEDLWIKVDAQYWQKLPVHRQEVIRVISHHPCPDVCHHCTTRYNQLNSDDWVWVTNWDSVVATISWQIKSIQLEITTWFIGHFTVQKPFIRDTLTFRQTVAWEQDH